MTCQNIWLEQNTGLHKKFSGDISIVDVLKENNELFSSPHFDGLNYVIYDFTDTTNETFRSEQTEAIAKVAQLRANTKEHLKVALISRNNPESTLAANQFCEKMKVCHYLCHVFHSLAEARVWISNH